jgi:N-acetylmuramoyl-L-alanine amidase
MKTIILDPGHGMSNRRAGVFDPGACGHGQREADIVMDWANEIRANLRRMHHRVVRTRAHPHDAAPLGKRVAIARDYGGDVMLSIHCNAGGGTGTETIYREEQNRRLAASINTVVWDVLRLRNRGVKTEEQLGRRLAVLAFPKCVLLEIGFIDNASDVARMIDPALRAEACRRIAHILAADF